VRRVGLIHADQAGNLGQWANPSLALGRATRSFLTAYRQLCRSSAHHGSTVHLQIVVTAPTGRISVKRSVLLVR
jgi:hypothetical protein